MSLLPLVLFLPFFSFSLFSLQKGLPLIFLLSVSGFFSIAHHHTVSCGFFMRSLEGQATLEWWSSLSLSLSLTNSPSLSHLLYVPFVYLPASSLRPLLHVSAVGSRWTWIRPPLRTGRRRVIWWAPWSEVSLIRALCRRTRGWPCHLWTPIRAAHEVRLAHHFKLKLIDWKLTVFAFMLIRQFCLLNSDLIFKLSLFQLSLLFLIPCISILYMWF